MRYGQTAAVVAVTGVLMGPGMTESVIAAKDTRSSGRIDPEWFVRETQ
jgi:hypothetical protein